MSESNEQYETTGLLSSKPKGSRSYREDGPDTWTFSRQVAHYLSQAPWYSPFSSSSASPDHEARGLPMEGADEAEEQHHRLQDAWAYFEHVVLPRHFIPDESQSATDGTNSKGAFLGKAKPGESALPTKLYSVWETQEQDLGDMGIGLGLYFFTLRGLGWLFLVAGLLNLPIMWYYSSRRYNNHTAVGLSWVLRSSAICTDQRWAPCPSCRWHDWEYFPRKFDRYAQTLQVDRLGHHETYTESLNFIKVNSCRFGYTFGWFAFGSVIVLAIALYIFCFEVLKRKEAVFDMNEQTTQDYSIRVENPPPNASDAEEWRTFFDQFGDNDSKESDNPAENHVVTCCTVALDNEILVRTLVERRRLLIQLETLLKPGVKFNKHDLDHAVDNTMEKDDSSWWSKVLFGTGNAKDVRKKIRLLDEEIEGLSTQTYHASEIFVSFENEQDQRKALKSLSLPSLAPLMDMVGISVLPGHHLFRGKHLLRVSEAPEPTAVRWAELDATLPVQVAQRLVTSTLTLACIVGSMFLIATCRYRYGATVAALIIATLNSLVPYICMAITAFESHTQEGTKSTSRYFKITIWLFLNTAVVTSIITPFTDTVSNAPDAITHSLYAIFVFELIRGPLLQFFDPTGFVYRHVLGPRTKNFRHMLLLFAGTPYELSERYTNMTNVIFLTFYYAVIFPAGFLFAAATLFVHYWTDKFCLLRVWSQAPGEGTRISVFCRTFIMLSLVIYVVMSSYSIAAFPYDNACEDANSTLPVLYIGNHTIYDFDNKEYQISISADESVYHFCNQDFLRYSPFPVFPPLPSKQQEGGEWMDADQVTITEVFGWTSVGVIAFVILVFLHRLVVPFLNGLFRNTYEPTGQASSLRFSDVKEIFAYVPQVRTAEDTFPLLVCDVSELDPELLGWNDPYLGNDYHNVVMDIPGLVDKPVLSKVYHWPRPEPRTEEIVEETKYQPRESILGHLFPFLAVN